MAKEFPPHLLKEWDYDKNGETDPRKITGGSGKSFYWICELGHSWYAVVKNRTKGTGCPYCAGTKVLTGFNDLVSTHPDIALQWDYEKNLTIDPTKITAGKQEQVFWLCSHGHSWKAYIHSRTQGHGCPYCSGNKPITGVNDFATVNPELAKQWDHQRNEISPDSITRSSGYEAHWLCDLGHSWVAKVNNRVMGSGCPYCKGRKVLPGFNDIATTHPEIARLWDYEKNPKRNTPNNYSRGSIDNVWWICSKGHSWDNTIAKTVSSQGSCPICMNKRVLPGFNDLETLFPDVSKRWDESRNGIKSSHVLSGSTKRTWWNCDRGHSYEAFVYAQTRPKVSCPRCGLEDQVSSMENDVHSWIETIYPGTIQRNIRGLIGRDELDFYIPDKDIAIEFNGIYWHSEDKGKDRNYHYGKWSRCKAQGIQLITIWEDDWRDRKDIVKSMIAHKLGVSDKDRIYARKTNVKEISYQESSEFLDKYHIQGSTTGSVYLGLEYQGDIVAVSVWRKNRSDLYLDRYATSVNVIGGMGKLLKAGKQWGYSNGLIKIITFADHEVSDGGLYERLGFVIDKEITPDYSYVVNNERIHKFNYRKKRFRNDPDLEYQEGMTERELTKLNGIRRVWDSGKSRYVIDLSRLSK